MAKLKKEKLVESSCVILAIYPGVIRPEFIYNDYHSKVSNPNYSRNLKGKHFTRW